MFGCSIISMRVIFADSRMEPAAKISIKSFFVEIIFCSVHSAAVFLHVRFRQKYFIRSKLPTQTAFAVCERKEMKLLYVESESNHLQYSSPVEALGFKFDC